MKTLLDNYPNGNDAKDLAQAFETLRLPVPLKGEFHHRFSQIVFINQAALTLRIQSNKRSPLLRHKHLLRPLGALKVNDALRIDIMQGGRTVTTESISYNLNKSLQKSFIYANDIAHHPANSLHLEICTKEFPEGFPAAYDPHILTFSKLSMAREFKASVHNSAMIDLLPSSKEKPDIQDFAYGDLRSTFQHAVNDNGEIEAEGLTRFYQACTKAAQEGRIRSPWKTKMPTWLPGLNRKSRAYADRLAAHNPAFEFENHA